MFLLVLAVSATGIYILYELNTQFTQDQYTKLNELLKFPSKEARAQFLAIFRILADQYYMPTAIDTNGLPIMDANEVAIEMHRNLMQMGEIIWDVQTEASPVSVLQDFINDSGIRYQVPTEFIQFYASWKNRHRLKLFLPSLTR